MIYALLVVFGLTFGSFVNALIWRLHEQATRNVTALAKKQSPSSSHSKGASKAKVTDTNSRSVSSKLWSSAAIFRKAKDDPLSVVYGRSMCPHCKHQLAERDLVPLFSWLSLRGRCRYCHKPISWQYPVVELLTAILFVLSYVFWPSGFHGAGLFEFIEWLILIIGFMALAVYDLRWYLLPDKIVMPLLGVVIVGIMSQFIFFHSGQHLFFESLTGVLIGGGIFYLLFQISSGTWIGGGDVKLGSLLGLIVGGPLAAVLLIFIASCLGTFLTLPFLVNKSLKISTRIPFGPFLIVSAIIMRIFGASMINWLQHRYIVP
jgi:prepilin signal peptidase PulO-like enzyme (type II secretory pathway)